MASVADFQTRFPEFCNQDDDRVQMFLDDAALRMNSPDKWLDFYDVAHQYLAAHYLYLAQQTESGDGGVTGPISHQEVDDVIIKQAVAEAAPTQDELLSTAYGKRYWTYRKTALVGPRGI